jgi:hypothetical protein
MMGQGEQWLPSTDPTPADSLHGDRLCPDGLCLFLLVVSHGEKMKGVILSWSAAQAKNLAVGTD